MNNQILIGGTILTLLIVGFVAGELEITSSVINIARPTVSEPSGGGGGIIDAIRAALAVAAWVFNVLGSIFQILTFQVDIPAIANTVIAFPLWMMILYTIVKLIRG
jgi:hypothetical protein